MKLSNDEKALLEKAIRITTQINKSINENVKRNDLDRIPGKKMITYQEAKLKYDIEPTNRKESDLILIFDGDVYVNGDLNVDWLSKQVSSIKWEGDFYGGIVIAGDLVVDGDVLDEDHLELHTTHNLSCDYLVSKNGVISIQGDVNVKYGIYGEYNDGELNVTGEVLAPYIIAQDHQMPRRSEGDFKYIEGGDGSEIDYLGIGKNQGASFGWGWDYFKDSGKLLSPEVWDQECFCTEHFFKLVRNGENPFISNNP